MKPKSKVRTTLLMAATLMTALTATHAFAGHDRRVVVRETHYSAPVLTYHSGPVSVYVGSDHSARHSTRHNTYHSAHRGTRVITTHRAPPWGNAHGYYARDHKKSYKRKGDYQSNHHHSDHGHSGYRHAPSRGSWSGDRREVIYVDRDARRHSNYRRVERNSVVIRERRR
jgi:hypothetical protein